VSVFLQLLLNLLKAAHHLGVLHLHLLKLHLQRLILLHLCGVLVVHTRQVLDHFGVLLLHIRHLVTPLLALLVFLLLQKLALLLYAVFFELEHLNLVINMASLDVAELKSILDIIDLLATSSCVHFLFLMLVLLINDGFASGLLLEDVTILLLIAAVALDVVVVGELLSRGRVALSLLFDAAVVGARVCAAERLIGARVIFARQRLLNVGLLASLLPQVVVVFSAVLVEDVPCTVFLILVFLIAFTRSFGDLIVINLGQVLGTGCRTQVLLNPTNNVAVAVD